MSHEEEEEENEDKTRKDDASLSSESSSLFTSVREIDEYIVNPKEMITDVIDSDPNVLREIEKLKKEKAALQAELDNAGDYILDQEERVNKSNLTAYELLQ